MQQWRSVESRLKTREQLAAGHSLRLRERLVVIIFDSLLRTQQSVAYNDLLLLHKRTRG
jgi:hypothetical protein